MVHVGNTPTRVGKTTRRLPGWAMLTKHPHTRGEDVEAMAPVWPMVETPPHAWGRPLFHGSGVALDGNTPTRVGKTPARLGMVQPGRKHPHTRGEDTKIMWTTLRQITIS